MLYAYRFQCLHRAQCKVTLAAGQFSTQILSIWAAFALGLSAPY